MKSKNSNNNEIKKDKTAATDEMTESEQTSPEPSASGMTASEQHRARGRRRRSVMRAQKRAVIILCVLVVLLGVALGIVTYYVNLVIYEDYDGLKYTVKEKNGTYVLCDSEGYTLETTKDGYFSTVLGTLVEVDGETGKYEVVAVVDTEEGESVGTSKRILMFKHVAQSNLQQLDVHNTYGSFTFYRDADDKIQIKGYEGTPYDQTIFSSLAVAAGYSLTMEKIVDPIKDANGKYTEYGLAEEVRTDADGKNYDYAPSWYRLTDTSGNYYTVYIGDEIPSGAGFYVKYSERDAVYIMNYSVDASILNMYDTNAGAESVANVMDLPIERFVSPVICYPMTLNTYFDVQNFTLFRGEDVVAAGNDPSKVADPIVCFSYWDLDERTGTFNANTAYLLKYPLGYYISDESADVALQSFYTMTFLGVTKLGITDEDYKKYGFDDPAFMIYFEFKDIEHYISVSHMTERGTYYLTSAIYDMIVEVDRSQLLYLDYKLINWIDDSYFQMNLAWATDITVESGNQKYTFLLDNSESDSVTNPTCSDDAKKKGTISSANLKLVATDAAGIRMESISSLTIKDKSGFTWTIDDETVKAVDSAGNKASIKGGYYATNAFGDEVVVLYGNIVGEDGTTVSVEANTIIVTEPSGVSHIYLRYGVDNFRRFYQSILYASISGDVHDGTYGMSDEKIAEYTADPDKNVQAKITINTSVEGKQYVYRFYAYSERRSMLTINGGNGEFYVLRTFTDKIVEDARRVISGEQVSATSKY